MRAQYIKIKADTVTELYDFIELLYEVIESDKEPRVIVDRDLSAHCFIDAPRSRDMFNEHH